MITGYEKEKPLNPGKYEGLYFYVSGPMKGYKDSNMPAFDDAKAMLILEGARVITPADISRNIGQPLDQNLPMPSNRALLDLKMVANNDCIYMLKGWERSFGAQAEHAVAVWLEKKIVYE